MPPQVIANTAESVYFSLFHAREEFTPPPPVLEMREGGEWRARGPVIGEDATGVRSLGDGEILFQVWPRRGRFDWVMDSDDLRIEFLGALDPKNPLMFPSVHVQLRARLVWALGYRDAILWALGFTAALFGKPVRSVVSRVDLASDLIGWKLTEDDHARFVTRARSSTQNQAVGASPDRVYRKPKFTGFDFGRGGFIMLRLYDKTQEIRVNSSKTWFYPIWERAGWDRESQVWRVEFQVRREALREFGLDGVLKSVKEFGSLWSYLTEDWIRHVRPKRGDVNRWRWPTSQAWRTVQATEWLDPKGSITRAKQQPAEEQHLRDMLLGIATTLGARRGARSTDDLMVALAEIVGKADESSLAETLEKKRERFELGSAIRAQ